MERGPTYLRRAASVALALVFPLAASSCIGGLGLTAHQFQKQANEIGSYSSEGSLLAHLAQRGLLKASYTGTHADQLATHAGGLVVRLRHAHPRNKELAKKRAKAVVLAAATVTDLRDLSHHPGDRAICNRIEHELASIDEQATKLAK